MTTSGVHLQENNKTAYKASEGITKERLVFNWPSRHNRSLESEWKVSTFICSFSGIFKALILWDFKHLFIFPLKEQCTAGAANRLNKSSLTHAHMKIPRNKHVHTHTSIKTCCGNGYFVLVSLHPSLLQRSAEQDPFTCISWELCKWASYGLPAAFFLFVTLKKCERIQRLKWRHSNDPEKGRMQLLHLPFCNHFNRIECNINKYTHTHTHIHTYIYIYIYIKEVNRLDT